MSDQLNVEQDGEKPSEKKKISLQDAIRNKLAQKQQQSAVDNSLPRQQTNGLKMKSQNHKKPNNQRRRTGGS